MWLTVHHRTSCKPMTLWFGPGGVVDVRQGDGDKGATLLDANGLAYRVAEDPADIADALSARAVYVSTPKAVA